MIHLDLVGDILLDAIADCETIEEAKEIINVQVACAKKRREEAERLYSRKTMGWYLYTDDANCERVLKQYIRATASRKLNLQEVEL